ncbi:Pentatricopeptide repeat-containing protein [Cucurbita argyrosperma subsp. argyrosperma]|nr:Pentatricopeptide repeat-containing protein [Cucurbita argyrosperma subsp. argyrosperma]
MNCNEENRGGDDRETEAPVLRNSVEAEGKPVIQIGSITDQHLTIDDNLLVDPKLLFIGSKIGEGAHGKVYEGRYRNQIVAIKVLHRGSTVEERAALENRFAREVNMMSRVKHENLVKFIGACKEPLMVIVTELLPGMSLRKYLMNNRKQQLDPRLAINFALDIARAMDCLHANGIIHRDLKPDNLLLTANQRSVKLADFGLAREESVTEMMTAETGTYRWMAPELYSTVTLRQGEKKHYNNKVDVYSFGIVLWELLTNRMPFEGMSNLQAAYAAAFKQERPSIPGDIPPDLAFIVQSCWVEDSKMRPSFSQIIRMLNAYLFTLPPPSSPSSPSSPKSDTTETPTSSNGRWNMVLKGALSYILPKLLRLSSMKELELTHAFIVKAGLCNHIPVMTKLIAFSSLSPSGSLPHAHALFQDISMDDSFICNTMIRAYSNSVFPLKALLIYNHMQRMDVHSDHFTYNFVLKACARAIKCTEKDDQCFGHDIISRKGAEIHSRVLKLGLDQDHHVQNSLLLMYSGCGLVVFARMLFEEMTVRSAVSWNIMMSAYNRVRDYKSADSLLQLMPQTNSGIRATEVTFISILGACAETGSLEMGKKIHESLKAEHYRIEGYLGNAIVDMYAKCGELSLALEVFNEMEMKPVSCWNAMIMGLAVHGYCERALDMFDSMEAGNDDHKPNRVTFVAILIACSHKGLVAEGRHFLSLMINKYKIMPDLKHYGCMVDLLSRWGFLQEAYEMIKGCPFSSCAVVWRTLLGGCRVHRHLELGEEAFCKLGELEARKDGDYVLLSNIYAEEERWDDVGRLRNEMIEYGVCKKAGSSHVKIQ